MCRGTSVQEWENMAATIIIELSEDNKLLCVHSGARRRYMIVMYEIPPALLAVIDAIVYFLTDQVRKYDCLVVFFDLILHQFENAARLRRNE